MPTTPAGGQVLGSAPREQRTRTLTTAVPHSIFSKSARSEGNEHRRGLRPTLVVTIPETGLRR